MKYLWRKTSGAAGNGLGITLKKNAGKKTSDAASNGLGATAKYLRRTKTSLLA
jgi:hypothetical protein